jgi:hypothetical protein
MAAWSWHAAIGQLPGAAGSWLAEPVTISRGWHLALLSIAALLVASTGTATFVAIRKRRAPTWRDYDCDEFFGVVWQWQYAEDGEIINLSCYCPRCEMRLEWSVKDPYFSKASDFVCERCGKIATHSDSRKDVLLRVKREIDRNIRLGHWREVIG